MLVIQVDGVVRQHLMRVATHRLAGVGIDVEAWKVTARDVESQAVTRLEQIAYRTKLDRDAADLTGGQEMLGLEPVAEAGANDGVHQVHVVARRKVGVAG